VTATITREQAPETEQEPGEPSARRPMPFATKVVTQALVTLAVGALGFVLYLVVISPIQQDRDQEILYAQLREELAAATAPTGGAIEAGHPIALLRIPGIELNQVMVEGTSGAELTAGPGHRRDTPLPGQGGVSVVYGRSSTFGAPFERIAGLQQGDQITVTTAQGQFEYKVDGVRRDGDPAPPAPAKGSGRLTLVTAEDGESHMVFLDATLVGNAAPIPAGRPRIIPPQEKAMASDTGAFIPLVIWLQVLGLALAAIVWARNRWGKWETYVAGTPIALAVVWTLYENLGRVLPNLL
jgi:sortase A